MPSIRTAHLSSLVAACTTALFLTACASTPSQSLAIQKENNQYEVTGLGKTQLISKNNAIAAANKSCGNRASPIVTDQQSTYNGALKGVVSDDTGQAIQAAASVIGNVTGLKTGLNQDTDYQTVLSFRCQSK